MCIKVHVHTHRATEIYTDIYGYIGNGGKDTFLPLSCLTLMWIGNGLMLCYAWKAYTAVMCAGNTNVEAPNEDLIK